MSAYGPDGLLMTPRLKVSFLLLVLFQAVHSVEEYFGRLWEVFVPARFLTSVVAPSDPVAGFLIINIGLALLGFACYLWIVRPATPSARAWVWFWIVLEAINALGHAAWSIASVSYQPGLVTVLPFYALVPVLVREMLKSAPQGIGQVAR